ncbi:unnamed protein product [Symbiodinium sp. CCMP2456]|nr:unnamed protein product [Symbiodinium sp. CCMP2456]
MQLPPSAGDDLTGCVLVKTGDESQFGDGVVKSMRRWSIETQSTVCPDGMPTDDTEESDDSDDDSVVLGDVVEVRVPRRLSHVLMEERSLPIDKEMRKSLVKANSWELCQEYCDFDVPLAPDRMDHEQHLEHLDSLLKFPGRLEECLKAKGVEVKSRFSRVFDVIMAAARERPEVQLCLCAWANMFVLWLAWLFAYFAFFH